MIGLGPSYRTVERRCPLCGHKLDGAAAVDDDDRPKEGDVFTRKSAPYCRRRFEPELVARVERARAAILSMDRRGMGDGSA
jgi:hypothetical protein